MIRDAFEILGSLKCECLSFLDLKGTYINEIIRYSKPYCGILTYFGSASCVYQRMPMELSANPAIWQSYRNAILSHRSKNLAIMDDLLLHNLKHSNLKYLEDLLKALLKRGWKISPKKCQLFRTELQFITPFLLKKNKSV